VNKLAFALVLLAAPIAAHATGGLRIGLGADVASHANGSTNVITDNWPLEGQVMFSYWLPSDIIALDVELAEQFFLNAPAGGGSRIGTVLRPGVRISPPVIPFYIRGAIPINLENPAPYDVGQGKYALRLGAGFNIPLVLFKIYIEADADFPLGGGTNAPDAFSNWALWLNGGLDFRF
jgi:hypothetical protein